MERLETDESADTPMLPLGGSAPMEGGTPTDGVTPADGATPTDGATDEGDTAPDYETAGKAVLDADFQQSVLGLLNSVQQALQTQDSTAAFNALYEAEAFLQTIPKDGEAETASTPIAEPPPLELGGGALPPTGGADTAGLGAAGGMGLEGLGGMGGETGGAAPPPLI